jgi:hypothetical protein
MTIDSACFVCFLCVPVRHGAEFLGICRMTLVFRVLGTAFQPPQSLLSIEFHHLDML